MDKIIITQKNPQKKTFKILIRVHWIGIQRVTVF